MQGQPGQLNEIRYHSSKRSSWVSGLLQSASQMPQSVPSYGNLILGLSTPFLTSVWCLFN